MKKGKKPRAKKVMICHKATFFGPGVEPLIKIEETPLIDGHMVYFGLTLDLRKVERIEITPVRRPLMDTKGCIRDAERLANEG